MSKLLIITTIFTVFIASSTSENQESPLLGSNIPNPINQALSIICNAFQNSNSPLLQEINLTNFPEQMQTAIKSPLFTLMRTASNLHKIPEKMFNPIYTKEENF